MKKRKFSWFHPICCCLLAISAYIMFVDQGILPGFIPCDSYKEYNHIFSSIAGSYIAGYLFYVITISIPGWIMAKKIKHLLLKKINVINSWVIVCGEPIHQLKVLMDKINSKDKVFLKPQDEEYQQVKHQLERISSEAKPLIKQAVYDFNKYFPYLSVSQKEYLENIDQAMLFNWTDHLMREQIPINELACLIQSYDDLKESSNDLVGSV